MKLSELDLPLVKEYLRQDRDEDDRLLKLQNLMFVIIQVNA